MISRKSVEYEYDRLAAIANVKPGDYRSLALMWGSAFGCALRAIHILAAGEHEPFTKHSGRTMESGKSSGSKHLERMMSGCGCQWARAQPRKQGLASARRPWSRCDLLAFPLALPSTPWTPPHLVCLRVCPKLASNWPQVAMAPPPPQAFIFL